MRNKDSQTFENTGHVSAGSLSLRTSWRDSFPEAVVDQPLGAATSNPLYEAAKSGDPEAAFRLAQMLVSDGAVEKLRQITVEDTKLVPVYAQEVLGLNAIPLGVAEVLSRKLGLSVDDRIVQAVKVGRTGKDGWYRLANIPTFVGEFEQGVKAFLIDDTLTQGGTFASLKGHIENLGGVVSGVYALTGKQYSRQLALSFTTLDNLRNAYGEIEQWWVEFFGYNFEYLTEWEARYILNSKKPADEVRDKIIAAQKT